VFIAHFGGETKTKAVELTYLLREAGIGTRLAFARDRRSMKSQMREANKYATQYVLILGGSELENGVITVRPMGDGEQTNVAFDELVSWLKNNL
jgi:histidyl-tRNA synthetase